MAGRRIYFYFLQIMKLMNTLKRVQTKWIKKNPAVLVRHMMMKKWQQLAILAQHLCNFKRPNNRGDPVVLARDWRAIIIGAGASVNDR